MRAFFDTEFIENGKTIDLLSIGIVDDNDRKLYLINSDCKLHMANSWVRENVLPKLPPYDDPAWQTKKVIAQAVRNFFREAITNEEPIDFWAWYCSYDWVALCQLFGKMADLPAGFPMYCHELKMLYEMKGAPTLPQQEDEHHALNDAIWAKEAYHLLLPYPFTEEWNREKLVSTV